MQANNYDASFNSANNFNNFDPSNQFPMQYPQPQSQTSFTQPEYQGGHIQQQFMGQSSVVEQQQQHQGINNGSTSAYQHSINDLLVQPTLTLQQNLFNSQEAVASNQSVSWLEFLINWPID